MFVITCKDSRGKIGYVGYPQNEYYAVNLEQATKYKTKKEAEKIKNWYNQRMGILMDMKVVVEGK